jgi:hypothetical protein
MSTNDDQAPAKRADVWLSRAETEARFTKLEQRIDGLEQKLEDWKQEIKDHFDLVAENLITDFKGIFKDRLEQHEDRITRLEQHAGIAPA